MTNASSRRQFDTKDVQCGQGQISFLGLAAGNYTVALTPLDGAGNPIVKAPITAQVAAGMPGADTELTINVPWDAWTGSYTGFRPSFAGFCTNVDAVWPNRSIR